MNEDYNEWMYDYTVHRQTAVSITLRSLLATSRVM